MFKKYMLFVCFIFAHIMMNFIHFNTNPWLNFPINRNEKQNLWKLLFRVYIRYVHLPLIIKNFDNLKYKLKKCCNKLFGEVTQIQTYKFARRNLIIYFAIVYSTITMNYILIVSRWYYKILFLLIFTVAELYFVKE